MNRFALVLLIAGPGTAQAACDPAGAFTRGARGPHQTSFQVSAIEGGYELQLDTYGQKYADGTRTVGTAKGKLAMSDHGCVGAYLVPAEECSLFVVFRADGAEVHQFGSCFFGAGAWAGGAYRRVRSVAPRGLTGRSSGSPSAPAELKR
jgi:hypothetical protein